LNPGLIIKMKCFEVIINGKRVCTAGIGEDGVLTSVVTFVKRNRSAEETAETKENNDSESLNIRVGGIANRETGAMEQVEWLEQRLVVGDEITIRIIEASECDEPNSKEVTYIECSFCGKKQNDVAKLIAGPAVFICNECVDDCSAALAEREPTGSITMLISKAAEAKCSFCGKSPIEVSGIVGVPTARICDQCIKICRDILSGDV